MKRLAVVLISLILMGGCSLFGSSSKKAEIRFIIQNSEFRDFFDTYRLFITATDGQRSLQIDREDFENYATAYHATANKGELQVSFEVNTVDGESLSAGEFQLNLREDWQWDVNLLADRAEVDPTDGCLGCFAVYSFAIDQDKTGKEATAPDSIYVIIGGNYISDPVDY